jgi:pimeloyl-ACP methyl ester carboxylesterase
VFRFAGYRPLVWVLLLLVAATPALLAAEGGIVSSPQSPTYILIGFVGGFLSHDNAHHNPVKVAQLLHQNSPKDAYIEVFENRHRKTALKTILHLLDANHNGVLSDDEKSAAHIMLFGHSWGGSATVILARELNRIGIPVMLTVQVDSVAKLWQKDAVIPENVAAAVNFYQPHGIIHGRSEIKAADDSKTRILGNYRFDYRQTPVRCEGYSWFDRIITPSHMQAECDPHIWTQVENLVRERMTPEPRRLAANPAP